MKKLMLAVVAVILAGCSTVDFEKMKSGDPADRLMYAEAVLRDPGLLDDICSEPGKITPRYDTLVCQNGDYLDEVIEFIEDNEFEKSGKIIENSIQNGADRQRNSNYTMHVVSAMNDSNRRFSIIYIKYDNEDWGIEYIRKQ